MLVIRTVSGEDCSPKSCCLSASVFGHRCSYDLLLVSAAGAFVVNSRMKVIDVSLEEGCDQLVDGRRERGRTSWSQLDSQLTMKMSRCIPASFCSGKAVGPLEFGGYVRWLRRRRLAEEHRR